MSVKWDKVKDTLASGDVRGIAFDGCHKIYVVLDDEHMQVMRGYGYGEDGSFLIESSNDAVLMATLRDWFNASCGLRFISSVRTVAGNPNEGFTELIEQGADEDEDEPRW